MYDKILVKAGRYKGHRRGDVADVMWTPGYHLPPIFRTGKASLGELCMQVISQKRINIDKLPPVMRWRVNTHHMRFGVRLITDSRYYTPVCHIHANMERKEKCRQCIRRVDAWDMLMLKIQKLHITEGILISQEKRMEIKEREEEEKAKMPTNEDKKKGGRQTGNKYKTL